MESGYGRRFITSRVPLYSFSASLAANAGVKLVPRLHLLKKTVRLPLHRNHKISRTAKQ